MFKFITVIYIKSVVFWNMLIWHMGTPPYLNMEMGGSSLPDYVVSIQNIPYYSHFGCTP